MIVPHDEVKNHAESERKRARFMLFGIIALLVLLGGRVVHINTALRSRLVALAEQQHRGSSLVPARRGTILDARGRVLAATRQAPDVFIDPIQADDLEAVAQRLAPRINVPADRIVHEVESRPGRRYVVLATEVDDITAEAVAKLNDPAVGLTDRAKRTYPLGRSAAHVVGFVGRDGRGLEGLELRYDAHLRGADGRRVTVRDARRRTLGHAAEPPRPPVDGGHLVLTIDAEVQRVTEDALRHAVAEFSAESGVGIVMSPWTGDVLAMALAPDFDLNEPGAFLPATRRNRVVTDPTEPGSAFKPIIACGALDGEFVSLTEKIDCHQGVHYFGGRRVTDTSPHGLLDLTGILTHSSNIGMGTIAQRMGNGVLHATIRRFGFGEVTGLECPGEDPGLVRPLHRWTSYSTNAVAIGYEIAATPIQLIAAFAAIVNDGVLLRPRVVRALLSPEGQLIEEFTGPHAVRRVASIDTARFLANEALVAVVADGSARHALNGPYRILGKTGTAKLPFADRQGYEPGAYVSTFVGAAPAAMPEIVVLVMIRRPNPSRGYFGSTVAAPAAGQILQATLAYFGVAPSERVALSGM